MNSTAEIAEKVVQMWIKWGEKVAMESTYCISNIQTSLDIVTKGLANCRLFPFYQYIGGVYGVSGVYWNIGWGGCVSPPIYLIITALDYKIDEPNLSKADLKSIRSVAYITEKGSLPTYLPTYLPTDRRGAVMDHSAWFIV